MDKANLTELSRKLISRIITEFKRYLLKPTEDQKLAMGTDPLTATIGLTDVELIGELLAHNGKHLIYRGSLTLLVGEEKAFKTMACQQLAWRGQERPSAQAPASCVARRLARQGS